jgi:ABC-type cobalamin/Fe3+-siderophores transport system ATPase subunit
VDIVDPALGTPPHVAFHYGDFFILLDGGRLVHAADGAEEVSGELIERVFRVAAHHVVDATNGQRIWRFSLPSDHPITGSTRREGRDAS